MSEEILQQGIPSTDEEKKTILNKAELDEVDRSFSLNAIRVLASRYLLRDELGNVTEGTKQLFERVATLIGLADLAYDRRLFDKEANQGPKALAAGSDELFNREPKIGRFKINRYHLKAFARLYGRLAEAGQMRIDFADVIAGIDAGDFDGYAKNIEAYCGLMLSKDFLPNTPTLMNAGARLGQLSACFVLDMKDDLEGIMKTSTDVAMIFKSGGGVGINYSDLRPEGDVVGSTHGVASGPISFMGIVDKITDVIKQGGKRRGANMGIMEAWHPDVVKFINAKKTPGILENFNISVALDGDFWAALSANEVYRQRNPKDGSIRGGIDPNHLLDLVAGSAWESAEPGVIFLDNVNRRNVLESARGMKLRATNPCGEQSLYPHESCNLGSINLANFVEDGKFFDFKRFDLSVRLATRFLDNVNDMNKYPTPEIAKASAETRRIGLGIMGLADLLFRLRIPYNSEGAHKLMSQIAEHLSFVSIHESIAVTKERGSFGLFERTTYIHGELPIEASYKAEGCNFDWNKLRIEIREHGLRNSLTTTIAPTGTLSMIADCSNGIEPAFALAFEKHVSVGKFFYANEILSDALKVKGLYSEELVKEIADNNGTLNGIGGIPHFMREVFVTAMDMTWTDHINVQAIWQRWIGNAISKTINMPKDASPEDVRAAYIMGHHLGLKGLTVYRDSSRREQVLHFKGK